MLVSGLPQGKNLKAWIPPRIALAVHLAQVRRLQTVIFSGEAISRNKRSKNLFSYQLEGKSCITQSFAVERLSFSSFLRTFVLEVYFPERRAPNMEFHFPRWNVSPNLASDLAPSCGSRIWQFLRFFVLPSCSGFGPGWARTWSRL